MTRTLRFRPFQKDLDEIILVERIVRLSKRDNGLTVIHFDGGEIETGDSINTLEARLNKDTEDE